ncbi:MAG: FAD-binding oxidoreductase [Limisphaerales bacterium]
MVHILHYLGAAFVILVMVQLGLAIIGTLRRQWLAGAVRRGALQLFDERIALAQVRRQRVENTVAPWMGNRKFEVDRVVHECVGVKSFYLKAHDKKPLATFEPGQFLTFSLDVPGHDKKVVRCYSLSDRPREEYYRVTIKHLEDGAGSGFFHESVREGAILDVKAPAGGFTLDLDSEQPVVLIAGGVGITPVLCMLNEMIKSQPNRKVWLFYGVRNGKEHIMKEHLAQVARDHSQVEIITFYSRPNAEDEEGKDHDIGHRMSLNDLRDILPSSNFEFYLCAGGEMMKTMVDALLTWGVSEKHIHKEAFGPASVPKTGNTVIQKAVRVIFAKSGKTLPWTPDTGSLLEMAEASKIETIDSSGCHAGSCGTCKTAIKTGEVEYLQDPSSAVEEGSCLTCICVPKSDITLDA